jgi:Cellulose binding domain
VNLRTNTSRFRSYALVIVALGAVTSGFIACGGPEVFHGAPLTTGAGGAGPDASVVLGAAGDNGGAGTGDPADAGDALPTGAAGDSGGAGTAATAGTAGSAGGTAGTGAAGAGAAGTGTAGTGTAGTGTAGTGAAGTGTAGAGAAGTNGKAGSGGTPDAGVDAPSGCNCSLTVQYECRQNGAKITIAAFSVKIVNTGTTSIPLANVNVRYWYTIDGTGAQSGTCASAAHPCTLSFQNATPAKANADQYAVISFGGGTLAPGTDTGEIQVQLQGTGTYTQTNDYSFSDTGANYPEDMTLTGYVSGKLVWGNLP